MEQYKIILLQGLPWSWKSTWALAQEWYYRFNKDDIRKEFKITKYSKADENLVRDTERKRVEEQMNKWWDIIVDNTHIWKDNPHIKFYKELATKYNYKFEVKFFDTPYEECIERDSKRPNPVGWQVIKKFNDILEKEKYPKHPEFKIWEDVTHRPLALIVDIDWTLAFSSHRSPYDYTQVENDEPNQRLTWLITALQMRYWHTLKTIIVSGRDDNCIYNWYGKSKRCI